MAPGMLNFIDIRTHLAYQAPFDVFARRTKKNAPNHRRRGAGSRLKDR
jgi:hypothetical protein